MRFVIFKSLHRHVYCFSVVGIYETLYFIHHIIFIIFVRSIGIQYNTLLKYFILNPSIQAAIWVSLGFSNCKV